MTTDRYFVCAEGCEPQWAGGLFDALYTQVENALKPCTCGSSRYLRVSFPFAFGAGVCTYKVLAAFLPKEACEFDSDDGANVAFYPFLAVCERLDEPDGCRHIWLPYWHVVNYPNGTVAKKYGQWAPHLDIRYFESLMEQARPAGFLK